MLIRIISFNFILLLMLISISFSPHHMIQSMESYENIQDNLIEILMQGDEKDYCQEQDYRILQSNLWWKGPQTMRDVPTVEINAVEALEELKENKEEKEKEELGEFKVKKEEEALEEFKVKKEKELEEFKENKEKELEEFKENKEKELEEFKENKEDNLEKSFKKPCPPIPPSIIGKRKQCISRDRDQIMMISKIEDMIQWAKELRKNFQISEEHLSKFNEIVERETINIDRRKISLDKFGEKLQELKLILNEDQKKYKIKIMKS